GHGQVRARPRERAGGERQREQEQRERNPAADRMPRLDNAREHVHVRVRDREARTPPVYPHGEQAEQRDGDTGERGGGRLEAHDCAHITPSWTSAPEPRGSASLTAIATDTFLPLTVRLTWIAVASWGFGGLSTLKAVAVQLSTSRWPGMHAIVVLP